MKLRRSSTHAGGTAGGQDGRPSALWGGGGLPAMSAATSPGHMSGLRPAAGLRRLGAWPAPRSTPQSSGQHAELPPSKASGTEARDLRTRRCWWRSPPTWRHRPGEREGYRKVWARLRICRDIRVARKRVLRLMRENNLLSPHRCHNAVPAIPMTVRSSRCPEPHVVHRWRSGVHGGRRLWLDLSPPFEHWNAECVGGHVCKRGDRFG